MNKSLTTSIPLLSTCFEGNQKTQLDGKEGTNRQKNNPCQSEQQMTMKLFYAGLMNTSRVLLPIKVT